MTYKDAFTSIESAKADSSCRKIKKNGMRTDSPIVTHQDINRGWWVLRSPNRYPVYFRRWIGAMEKADRIAKILK